MKPLLLALLLAGCVPEPWLEVGAGDGGFRSLEDGDTLFVENGSQGGRHVWVGLQADGIEPGSVSDAEAMRTGDRPRVAFRLDGPDGTYSLETERHLPLEPSDGPGWELTDQLLPFRLYAVLPEGWQDIDWAAVEAELDGGSFELIATLEDHTGVELQDRREVRLKFPGR